MLLDLEINHKVKHGILDSISSCNCGDIATLSYAYDLIVSKATINNCWEILDSLDKFREWTCLVVNDKKSSIVIPPSLHPRLKRAILRCLRFNEAPSW